MGRLENKVAIITGGSGGMGYEHAKRFIKEGAKVVVADLDEEKGQKIAEELGDNSFFFKLDVTNEAEWEAIVKETEEKFGPVDILVNNAGISPQDTIKDLDYEDYQKTIKINQDGIVLGIKAVYPSMKKTEAGSIINISSMLGLVASPMTTSYTTSKFAVRGLTKSAAVELAADNIRVNSVHPGTIETPMVSSLEGEAKAALDSLKDRIPLGRLAKSEEVTNLVLFLASDEASYCTASEFVIDGGLTALM